MYNIEEVKKAKTTDEFEFVCRQCGKIFTKSKLYLRKNHYKEPKFCCQECQKEWYKKNSYVEVKCEKCGKTLTILKSTYDKSKSKHFFCSHSCSASYNNTKRKRKESDITWVDDEKKKGYNKCPLCGNLKYYKSKLCSDCNNKKKRKIKERTLGSYVNGKKYLTSKCSDIRRDARRTIEESKKEKVCAYCHNHEFDDILEVHHIKGILEFDRNTTIAEINDENNLVWLCPNHHQMIELGLIHL